MKKLELTFDEQAEQLKTAIRNLIFDSKLYQENDHEVFKNPDTGDANIEIFHPTDEDCSFSITFHILHNN